MKSLFPAGRSHSVPCGGIAAATRELGVEMLATRASQRATARRVSRSTGGLTSWQPVLRMERGDAICSTPVVRDRDAGEPMRGPGSAGHRRRAPVQGTVGAVTRVAGGTSVVSPSRCSTGLGPSSCMSSLRCEGDTQTTQAAAPRACSYKLGVKKKAQLSLGLFRCVLECRDPTWGRTPAQAVRPQLCARTASRRSATMLVILIAGFTAGPAVSL